MFYQVNDLLSITRLPIHYWNEVNSVESMLDNPGKQLQSWIVAFALDQESVVIDPQLRGLVETCDDFSQKLAPLLNWAEEELEYMLEFAYSFNQDKKINQGQLGQVTKRIRDLLNTLPEARDRILVHSVDDTSPVSDLIELRGAVKLIHEKLHELGIDPTR